MNDKILKTIKNLERNNMKPYYCETKEEALSLVKELLPNGCTVSHGGSESLKESGIISLLNSGDYNYLDRSKCNTREETEEIYRKSFSADVYLTSSNAVTENGELYNVDG
ncbi:MAG: lactate utilization protein, partial [Clostridia bacterium]|nr:lactate utilization protein [Clostridia bacterium]